MKRFLKLKTSLFLLLILPIAQFSGINSVLANFSTPVIDPEDRLDFISPSPNSVVKGSINVRFGLYDDENTAPNYEVRLFDYATCNNQSFGHIILPPLPNLNSSKEVSFVWNTTATQSVSSLADGNYCLRVCAALKNSGVDYSACDARQIRIANTNRIPSITSTPLKLQFKQGEIFNYQIIASDPDGDNLTYRFSQTASFLSINPQTGLITSTALNALGYESLKYPIQIIVSDGKGGEVSQSFTLEIIGPKPPTPPITQNPPKQDGNNQQGNNNNNNDGNNNNNNPDEVLDPDTDEPQEEIKIELINPQQNEIINQSIYKIKWKGLNTGVEALKIEVSSNLTDWITIADNIQPEQTYFLWDARGQAPGRYSFRFSITDKNGKETQQISSEFEITEKDNNQDSDNIPIIINFKPEAGSKISNEFPTIISGQFIPSLGSNIDVSSVTIKLGAREYNDFCQISEDEFICDSKERLSAGRYSVSITFKDTSNKEGNAEWFFDITGEGGQVIEENNSDNSGTIILFGRVITVGGLIILIIILIIALILLIVPWTLYSIWRKKRETTVTKTEYTSYGIDSYNPPDTGLLPNLNVYSQPVVDPYIPAPVPNVNVNYYPVTPVAGTTTTTTTDTSQSDNFIEPSQTS